jgi:hypothetical protein
MSDEKPRVVFMGAETIAQVVKGRLEAAGIESYLWGENIAGTLPLGDRGVAGFGAVKVVVAEKDLERASILLNEDRPVPD